MQNYHDDSAIQVDDDDLFGRKDYALKLADIVASLGSERNFVVGLYSKWGYGKTSTLNLVKTHLDANEAVEIIDLEPWNYVTSKELAANLLYELSEKLGLNDTPKKKFGKLFRKTQGKASQIVNEAASSTSIKPAEGVSVSLGNVTGAVLALTQILSSPREYAIQKERIEKVISENGKQVVVFSDDIDRLDSEKILGVFKLIKSVASIKGVTYVVSFDEQVVADAISESLPKKTGGKEYIDKIIQIPVMLPLIERYDLDKYTDTKIDAVLQQNNVSISEDEQGDLQELYKKVKHKLDTPRAINRFANALLFAVPMLKDEVSTSDLVAVELLRVTYPDLYEAVRNNRELLTREGVYDSFDDDDKAQESKDEFDAVFQSNAEWMGILRTLFPNVNKYYYRGSSSDDAKVNRKYKRLKSFEYFHRYFTYAVGANDMSDVYFIEQLQKKDLSEQDLGKLLEKDYARGLQRIEDNVEIINDVAKFAATLILAVEKLPRESTGFLSTVPVEKTLYLISSLIEQHPDTKALDVYLGILRSCRTTEALSYLMRRVNVMNNSEDPAVRNLTDDEFTTFKSESVKVIQKLIDSNKLPIDDYTTVSAELYEFMRMFEGSTDSVNTYIRSRIKTGKQAIDFISQFLGKWSNLGSGKHFRSDLFDNGATAYKYWFADKLDAQHLYDKLVRSNDFKKFKGIKKADVREFDRYGRSDIDIQTGSEKNQEFRDVIAQQFIYLFETGIKVAESQTSEQTNPANAVAAPVHVADVPAPASSPSTPQ